MTTAGEAALRRVLAVFDLLIDAVDEDTLVPALLPLLLRAVPGDSIVWTAHPVRAGPLSLPADLLDAGMLSAFERAAATDPLVAHTTTGAGYPVRRSDLQSPADRRAMDLYREVYRPLGAEYQLAMSFPAGRSDGTPRTVCLVVNRRDVDFADTDVETARMLRGRLGRAMDRLTHTSLQPTVPQPPEDARDVRTQVTEREAAVLDLLAHGLTNEQIGHRLAISPRTVDKHLEHAYPKLQVGGRVAAATVWLAGAGA
ncbi:helix-turn-helix transcriptional regulator [Actinacidiphila acidipaludis]|uniref:LuxR C-terminal-related transcriptional regulator n=1 Tax=Actinacidiphila acidipaludis TaxID=2873382 RepID=A0ABS7QGQ1_9ACTN|nr:LuxR C-terminal-related transcriptional regulator [Streptomyces acidipaludis]MBY8882351.1 LuxR C-terminal-related transcriptional regulator [Streptomyces acidipaludis]